MITSALIVSTLAFAFLALRLYRRRGDAIEDTVTGLPSRAFFERYLRQCAARSTRHPRYGFAVLLLDIRGFSTLRRDLGRFAAEEILADFAERLRLCIRPSDLVTRFDGDNFALILDDVRRITDATRVALRVQDAMTEAVTLAAQPVSVRVNVGVSMTTAGVASDPRLMLQEAESARARAVEVGRPYVVFDQALDSRSLSDLALERQLAHALDGDELRMTFAPILRDDTGELAGFAAQPEWDHPERGLLRANEFLPIAEGSEDMLRIGAWIVTEACDALLQLARTTADPPIMAVSVSETELTRGNVALVVENALGDRIEFAQLLRVGVPASALSNVGPAARTALVRLRALGVALHVSSSRALDLSPVVEAGNPKSELSLLAAIYPTGGATSVHAIEPVPFEVALALTRGEFPELPRRASAIPGPRYLPGLPPEDDASIG